MRLKTYNPPPKKKKQVNMRLKVDDRARKEMLEAGIECWLPPLLHLASMGCWRHRRQQREEENAASTGTGGGIEQWQVGGYAHALFFFWSFSYDETKKAPASPACVFFGDMNNPPLYACRTWPRSAK